MIEASVLTVPYGTKPILGKATKDLIGIDAGVEKDGSVIGTIKYVKGYKEFSSVTAEQSGNYFPVHLTKTGRTVEIKKNGEEGKSVPFDPDCVLRVSATDKFEILVDGESVVTLNFKKATLLKK